MASNRKMTRFQALLIEFGGFDIPLNEVAEKYLGLSPAKANNYARLHKLPFPTFRAWSSQKAPRMVNAHELALYLDKQEKREQREYEALRAAAAESNDSLWPH